MILFTEEMKQEIVIGLTNIFKTSLQQIILYGSVARGTETPESDIDIAIIIKETKSKEIHNEFISWVADMDLKCDRVFSIIDIDSERFNKWNSSLPFYRNIKEDGIVLWTEK